MTLPTNERYIIFLLPRYFKKGFFNRIYKRIIKSLENKGIIVYYIKETIKEIKEQKSQKISFDKKIYPDINQLYIHLFNGQYYSDHIYNKKKIEKEREMLLLLAGKLGVKEINYKTEVIETTLTRLNGGVNIKNIDNSINFSKAVSRNIGISGREIYENRGAPVYLKFNNLNDVEENIRNKLGSMESNVFSYDYYKHSPKLESFVYKRYEFKMLKLEYTIESDDISDISFAVKSCFMDWGINYSFDKSTTFTEKITYSLEFFTDEELKLAFNKILFEKQREEYDPFYLIREIYDAHDEKDTAVHIICEYVIKEASKTNYKDPSTNKINDFTKKLRDWINNQDPGSFEGLCHQFRSTSQIRTWLYRILLKDDEEIIYNDVVLDVTSSNRTDSLMETNKITNIVQRLMYKPHKKVINEKLKSSMETYIELQKKKEELENEKLKSSMEKQDGKEELHNDKLKGSIKTHTELQQKKEELRSSIETYIEMQKEKEKNIREEKIIV